MKHNNPTKNGVAEETKKKISETLRRKQCNTGSKNGMNTKPEARLVIAEKNSKVHVLKHIETNEIVYIKNMYKWTRDHKLNPSSVSVWFSKQRPVLGWIRIDSYFL